MSSGSPLNATQRNGPLPFAKKRADVFGNEPGNIERVFDAGFFRLGANVVSVIESDRAFFLQRQHRLDVHAPSIASSARYIRPDFCARSVQRFRRATSRSAHSHSAHHARWFDLSAHRGQCRACTISGSTSAQLPTSPTEIACRSFRASSINLQRFIERPRDLIAIAALQSLLDARGIDFDAEKNRAVHGRGERLCAAHAAEPAGDAQIFLQATRQNVARPAAAKVSNVPCTMPWLPM